MNLHKVLSCSIQVSDYVNGRSMDRTTLKQLHGRGLRQFNLERPRFAFRRTHEQLFTKTYGHEKFFGHSCWCVRVSFYTMAQIENCWFTIGVNIAVSYLLFLSMFLVCLLVLFSVSLFVYRDRKVHVQTYRQALQCPLIILK